MPPTSVPRQPALEIHNTEHASGKEHVEARIRLSGDELLFGKYKGIDDQSHMRFDVEEVEDRATHTARSEGAASWIQFHPKVTIGCFVNGPKPKP